jgi:hypothetical protein
LDRLELETGGERYHSHGYCCSLQMMSIKAICYQ